MNRQTMRSAKQTALIARFEAFYANARAPVMAAIERRVCGCDYGGNSWTTRAEADRLARLLRLRPGMRLLDLGAGSGWPGLYFAKTTGCDAALIDLPHNGLRVAAQRAAADGLDGTVRITQADASMLPFATASFDAVSHSDLLCCLEPKRAVLAACRAANRETGRMAFTVISIDPKLSGAAYRRAVANGPDFVESEADYPTLLDETGWTLSWHEDITRAYAASCQDQIDADLAYKDALAALIGEDAFAERVAGWHSKLAAVTDGLLRRELFVAAPRQNLRNGAV